MTRAAGMDFVGGGKITGRADDVDLALIIGEIQHYPDGTSQFSRKGTVL